MSEAAALMAFFDIALALVVGWTLRGYHEREMARRKKEKEQVK